MKKITIIDHDLVEETNLSRQVLFCEKDVGRLKIEAAKAALLARNSETEINIINESVTEESINYLIGKEDFVVLSADRPIHFIQKWTNAACMSRAIPFLNVGYSDGEGVLGPLVVPGKTACMACSGTLRGDNNYLKEVEWVKEIVRLFRTPSFVCLNSLISSMASYEVIKYLLNIGDCISINNTIRVNPMDFSIVKIPQNKNSECQVCHLYQMRAAHVSQ